MVLGAGLLVLGIETLLTPTDWINANMPRSPSMWIGAAICFYFLRGVPDKGFQRSWGRWPQLITVLLAILAIVYNLVRTGNWWGRPLGALMFVLIVYVTAHLGLSWMRNGCHPSRRGEIHWPRSGCTALTYGADPLG
jgi:hypothetical protein